MGNSNSMRIKFILVVLAQLIFLVIMIFTKSYTLAYGEKILLKTAPVDPRSLFSGDYIMLKYDVSTIDLKNVEADIQYNKFKTGYDQKEYAAIRRQLQQVYVKLSKKEGEKFWTVTSATLKKPTVNAGEVLIIGKEGTYSYWEDNPKIQLKYGIESYYVAEGTGRQYEQNINNRAIETYIEVAVDKSGKAGIVGIYQDGKKIN